MKASIAYLRAAEILLEEAVKTASSVPVTIRGDWLVGGFSRVPVEGNNWIRGCCIPLSKEEAGACSLAKEKIKFISSAFSRAPMRDERPIGIDGSGNTLRVWEEWESALKMRIYEGVLGLSDRKAGEDLIMEAVKATEAAEQLGVAPVNTHNQGLAALAAAGKPEFSALSAALRQKAQEEGPFVN